MSCSGIYQILNLKRGKRYIGSAISPKKRLGRHHSMLKHNRHPNRHLQSAWNKDGENSFKFLILIVCRKEDLLLYEQRAIDHFGASIYNMSRVAGSLFGFRHSPEVKKKMSLLKIGRKLSREHAQAISIALKGHAVSERTIAAAKRRRGGTFSKEQRGRMASAAKKRAAAMDEKSTRLMMERVRSHRKHLKSSFL